MKVCPVYRDIRLSRKPSMSGLSWWIQVQEEGLSAQVCPVYRYGPAFRSVSMSGLSSWTDVQEQAGRGRSDRGSPGSIGGRGPGWADGQSMSGLSVVAGRRGEVCPVQRERKHPGAGRSAQMARSFQLEGFGGCLCQVAARSGREDGPGRPLASLWRDYPAWDGEFDVLGARASQKRSWGLRFRPPVLPRNRSIAWMQGPFRRRGCRGCGPSRRGVRVSFGT